jgi:hypothetical protein
MMVMMVMMMVRAVIWGVGMAGWEDQSPIEGKAPVRGVDNYLHSSGNYHGADDFGDFCDLGLNIILPSRS